jgi:hypothetical protein
LRRRRRRSENEKAIMKMMAINRENMRIEQIIYDYVDKPLNVRTCIEVEFMKIKTFNKIAYGFRFETSNLRIA